MASKVKNLDQFLLSQLTGSRIGVTLPAQEVPRTMADMKKYHNVSVPEDVAAPWQTASGSMHADVNCAEAGAIGEALERYTAAVARFPIKSREEIGSLDGGLVLPEEFALYSDEQYSGEGFQWKKESLSETQFAEVYSLYDNSKHWVPQELVGLGSQVEPGTIISTSTGLAAHSDIGLAIMSALHEVLERDALATYWLNGLGGREIPLGDERLEEIKKKGGVAYCFDITQEWNPHPVVIVCGGVPLRGRMRYSMGVACRASYASAIEKAYSELLQGVVFTGFYSTENPELKLSSAKEATSFDLHAVYYTQNPGEWEHIPLIKDRSFHVARAKECYESDINIALEKILGSLKQAGIRLFYRNLTGSDVASGGVTVVRVMSPELALIHGDERAPFLGGRMRDTAWRYPNVEAAKILFPNPYPHPLG